MKGLELKISYCAFCQSYYRNLLDGVRWTREKWKMSPGQVVGWGSDHWQLDLWPAISIIYHWYFLLFLLQAHISLLFCLAAVLSETRCLTIPGIPPPPFSPPLPLLSPSPLPSPPSPPSSPPPPPSPPYPSPFSPLPLKVSGSSELRTEEAACASRPRGGRTQCHVMS